MNSIAPYVERIAEAAQGIQAATEAIASAITAKGGTVGAGDGLEEFPAAVATIPSGPPEPVYPDEYVSDGLYLCLDAINNAGDHHDADATSWVDTVGGIEFTQKDSAAPEVGENYIHFDGTNKRYHYTGTIAEPAYVEVVLQSPLSASGVVMQLKGSGDLLGSVFQYSSGNVQAANMKSGGTLRSRVAISANKVFSVGGTKSLGMMLNGKLTMSLNSSEHWTDNTTETLIGGYVSGSYPFNGHICAIRYYNRVLSADEIAQNFAQDKKRFGVGEDITDFFPQP